MLETVERKLARWGLWLAQRAAGGATGYPKTSTTHMIRQMAPEPDHPQLMVWYCNTCNHRMARYARPSKCQACGTRQLRLSESVCHGAEKPKTKRHHDPGLLDDEDAEEMDRLVSRLPERQMRVALRMLYQYQYSERLSARMLRIPHTRFRLIVKAAKYWLMGAMEAKNGPS